MTESRHCSHLLYSWYSRIHWSPHVCRSQLKQACSRHVISAVNAWLAVAFFIYIRYKESHSHSGYKIYWLGLSLPKDEELGLIKCSCHPPPSIYPHLAYHEPLFRFFMSRSRGSGSRRKLHVSRTFWLGNWEAKKRMYLWSFMVSDRIIDVP